MSCSEVCLDIDIGCEATELFRESRPVARKEWRCVECGRSIQPGERYERASGKTEGDFWSVASCSHCAEIRKAFVCGGWYYGMLWESIEEGMFPVWKEKGPIDCLAKLESKEARDYARERYAEWCEDFVE